MRIALIVILLAGLLFVACGNDEQSMAPPPKATCPELVVEDDGTGLPAGGVPDLIVSEVSPDNFIELYNTTDTDIELVRKDYYLCSPFEYAWLPTLAQNTVVPAHGFATVPYPTEFTDNIARGEILLFRNSGFQDPNNILDFMCWGQGTRGSRQSQAESVGKWSGPCAGGLLKRSIQRVTMTAGTDASAYDVGSSPTPRNCGPSP